MSATFMDEAENPKPVPLEFRHRRRRTLRLRGLCARPFQIAVRLRETQARGIPNSFRTRQLPLHLLQLACAEIERRLRSKFERPHSASIC